MSSRRIFVYFVIAALASCLAARDRGVLLAAPPIQDEEGEKGKKPADGDDEKTPPEDAPPPDEPPPQEEPPADNPPPGDAESEPVKIPEFTKDTGKEEFSKAKSLFDEGKWKDAESAFKKLKADAKAKEDKDIVDSWALASGGGLVLERVKAKVKQRQFTVAQREAESYLKKYRGTPIEPAYHQVLQEIEKELYVVIESFDVPSSAFSEKYGKTYVNDADVLLDGTRCLRWANTKERDNVTLRLRNVPRDWSRMEAVEFWVRITAPPSDAELVVGCGEPATTKKKGVAKTTKKKKTDDDTGSAFQAQIRLPSGRQWQRIQVPLDAFQAQGDANFATVNFFQIQVGGGKQFDFLIDKVALVKKSGGAAGAETPKKAAPGKK